MNDGKGKRDPQAGKRQVGAEGRGWSESREQEASRNVKKDLLRISTFASPVHILLCMGRGSGGSHLQGTIQGRQGNRTYLYKDSVASLYLS